MSEHESAIGGPVGLDSPGTISGVRPPNRLRSVGTGPLNGEHPDVRPLNGRHPDLRPLNGGHLEAETPDAECLDAESPDAESPDAEPLEALPIDRPERAGRRPPRFLRSVLAQAFRKIRADRVLGLAAEAGFWGIVSLPALALSVFGGLGYLRGVLGDSVVNSVRDDVLRAAGDVLTPSTVSADVAPLLNQILARGHPEVISIAFIVSLWSGSTCMSDYVNTITVAYEMRGLRAWYRTRLRSLVLYLGAVASGIVLLPALALGPNLISNLFPDSIRDQISLTVEILYVPVVGFGSVAVVAGLYHLALPRRVPWRRGLPGATLAVALWLAGSFGVRTYLTSSFHNKSVYGSLSAPIAALIFFYVTALAVLIGAEINSAIDVVHARPVVARARRDLRFRRLVEERRRRRLGNGRTSGSDDNHPGRVTEAIAAIDANGATADIAGTDLGSEDTDSCDDLGDTDLADDDAMATQVRRNGWGEPPYPGLWRGGEMPPEEAPSVDPAAEDVRGGRGG